MRARGDETLRTYRRALPAANGSNQFFEHAVGWMADLGSIRRLILCVARRSPHHRDRRAL
jgi:hypothetical protein